MKTNNKNKKAPTPQYNVGGDILGGLSPFLSLIPGVGSILGTAAGIGGQLLNNIPEKTKEAQEPQLYTRGVNLTGTYEEGGPVNINLKKKNFNKLADGVYITKGPSHEKGGIKAKTKSGENVELEGEEIILDDKSYVIRESLSNRVKNTFKNLGGKTDNVSKKTLELLKNKVIAENEMQKMETGGPINGDDKNKKKATTNNTIYTSDKNDPRLTAYQDSLNLYNSGKEAFLAYAKSFTENDYKPSSDWGKVTPNKADVKHALDGWNYIATFNYEDGDAASHAQTKNYRNLLSKSLETGIYPTNILYPEENYPSLIFKKPVQPVEYRSVVDKVNSRIPDVKTTGKIKFPKSKTIIESLPTPAFTYHDRVYGPNDKGIYGDIGAASDFDLDKIKYNASTWEQAQELSRDLSMRKRSKITKFAEGGDLGRDGKNKKGKSKKNEIKIGDNTIKGINTLSEYKKAYNEGRVLNYNPVKKAPEVLLDEVQITPANGIVENIPKEKKQGKYKYSMSDDLVKRYEHFEDWNGKIYKDHKKIPTIGYGFNMTQPHIKKAFVEAGLNPHDYISGKKELTREQGRELLYNFYNTAYLDAEAQFPDLESYPDKIKDLIVDLSYNAGGPALKRSFKSFSDNIKKKDYNMAANALRFNNPADSTSGNRSYYFPKGNKNPNKRAVENIKILQEQAKIEEMKNKSKKIATKSYELGGPFNKFKYINPNLNLDLTKGINFAGLPAQESPYTTYDLSLDSGASSSKGLSWTPGDKWQVGLSFLPAAVNTARGLFEKSKVEKPIFNQEADGVKNLMHNRSINMDPVNNLINRNVTAGLNTINNMTSSDSTRRANMLSMINKGMSQSSLANIEGQKANNAYRGEEASMLNALGQQEAASKLLAQQSTNANMIAKDNLLTTGLGQLGAAGNFAALASNNNKQNEMMLSTLNAAYPHFEFSAEDIDAFLKGNFSTLDPKKYLVLKEYTENKGDS